MPSNFLCFSRYASASLICLPISLSLQLQSPFRLLRQSISTWLHRTSERETTSGVETTDVPSGCPTQTLGFEANTSSLWQSSCLSAHSKTHGSIFARSKPFGYFIR